MVQKAKMPTLTASGWVDNIAEKADSAMAYYFTSDFSQSNVWAGQITSLPYEVQQNNSDPQSLQRVIQQDIKNYLGRYFDTVTCNVSTDLPNADDPTRINVTLNVIVTEGGLNYSLGRLIQTVKGKIVNVANINNNPITG